MYTTQRQEEDFKNSILPSRWLEDIIEYISSHFDPEDVFSNEDLEQWAEENGYIKDE